MMTILCEKYPAFRQVVSRIALPGTLLLAACAPVLAQQPNQKLFASAGEASRMLFTAIQNRDEQALKRLFGIQPTLLASSDKAEEEHDRTRFLAKYQQMHRLVREPDGRTVLYIGAENWPFPIPLASAKGGWYFDTRVGMEEMTCRCVGENEAKAAETCHALARAQNPPVANSKSLQHGYCFRAVGSGSGSAAKKVGGVAFVAYPAEYEVTGVKTFFVSPQGVLYEKDLGPNGAKRARAMTRYRVDSTWIAVK